MKILKLGFILTCFLVFGLSCTSKKKSFDDDEFSTEAEVSSTKNADDDLNLDEALAEPKSAGSDKQSTVADEFAEFEDTKIEKPAAAAVAKEDDLEKEMDQLNQPAASIAETAVPAPVNEPAPVAEITPQVTSDIPQPEVPSSTSVLNEPVVSEAKPEIPAINPNDSSPVAASDSGQINQISSVQYKSNQNGGTVVISSQQPLQFTTRLNSATNQLVVEVQNAVIPKKLKRTLNTKDMASSIGSVDIYQKTKSKVARFVVQLRPGSSEPLVQPEGNSLLIVGGSNPAYAAKNSSPPQETTNEASVFTGQPSNNSSATGSANAAASNSSVNPDLTSEGIMNAQSLEDFLASNNKFYGKKISIEAVKLNVNDAFKFLSEESGINMIIDDDVTGDVTLKLRQVPWDQAFVLILKSKKLGYKRQGNVIRISAVGTLIKEDEDAIKLKDARLGNEPLAVKRFFIGYADIPELEKKIKDFLSSTTVSPTGALITNAPRGKVISDVRTSSMIVTETAANLVKIEKLISALDSQPQQVLIEGKVVEAGEKFVRTLGVNWKTPPEGALGSAPGTNLIRPSVSFDPGIASSIFNPSVGVGLISSPGDFGNLTASLSLGEKEDKVRILSAPRISVLSNQKANIAQTVNVTVPAGITVAPDGTKTVNNTTVAVGVSLNVTPQVSNEGTVVMDLDIERSFPGSSVSSDIEKRNAKTKVIVRSGQTAVIGGIFQADVTETTNGIPFFKDIPVFGHLFKGNQKSKIKNELVIFITPRILKPVQGDPTAASAVE